MSKRSCEYCRYFTDGCRCRARDEQITSSILFDEGCPHFEESKQTVFDYITQSVETLAEELVYIIRCEEDPTWTEWGSNIVQGVFETREEAVAATIEELKKEVNNDC